MKNELKNKLPVHTPPDAVWEKIAEELSPLRQLNGHSPPEWVWQHIEAELDKDKGVLFVPKRWWYASAAAASIVLILGAIWWNSNSASPQEKITYSEEKEIKLLIINTSDEARRQSAQIEAYCAEQVVACQKPAFRSLKRKLDGLNLAHQQLKAVVETYNPDPALVAQFARIENTRADVLRKLSEQI